MTARAESAPSATAQVAALHAQLLELANQLLALQGPLAPSGRVLVNAYLCAAVSLLCDRRLVPSQDALHWLDMAREQVEQAALAAPDRPHDA